MKKLTLATAAIIQLFGVVVSRGANLDKISAATGVPVETLQAERASSGLGWGGIEKAHLLANATGQNLGRLVSNANRSSQAMSHAKNTQPVHGKSSSTHGKSATKTGRGHSSKMTATRGVGHGSSFRSAHTGFHGTRGTGGMGHGMGGMGHGGHGR